MQNIDYFYYLLLSIIASSMIIILYILRQNKGINIGRPRKLKKKIKSKEQLIIWVKWMWISNRESTIY